MVEIINKYINKFYIYENIFKEDKKFRMRGVDKYPTFNN